MDDQPRITVPNMCHKHQRLLVTQLGIGPRGPWRSHIIVAQLVLLQATTAHADTYDRIGENLERIGELGCLACFRPDAFGEIVDAFQSGGLAAVKALGEKKVTDAARGSDAHGAH
jgi:hypothetical protein